MHVIQVQQIDEGEYICTVEQSKGTKQTTSKRQRIDVSLIGKTLKVQLTSLAWVVCFLIVDHVICSGDFVFYPS